MRSAKKLGILVGVVLAIAAAFGARTAASRRKATAPPPTHEAKQPEAPRLAHEPTPPRTPLGSDGSLPPTIGAVAPQKPAAAKTKPLTEAELIEKLRKAQDTDDHRLSYDLAREGLRRFPDSPDAPEMAAMVVKSLARQGKISEARAEAEEMVNKYAGSRWAREVERHTGAHPHPNQAPPP